MKVQRITKVALLLVVFSAALTGCYYDNEEELYQYYYQQNQCDTVNVTFQNTIFPIIQGNCTTSGCHVAGGTGNGIFDSYAAVKAKVDNGSFHDRVIVKKDMPPSHQLTECQLSQINKWLNNGAIDN